MYCHQNQLFLSFEAGYLLIGIGVIPNHFRTSQLVNINFKIGFGFTIVSSSSEDIGSSDKCVVFVPKRLIEMKIAKILSLPLVTPN